MTNSSVKVYEDCSFSKLWLTIWATRYLHQSAHSSMYASLTNNENVFIASY